MTISRAFSALIYAGLFTAAPASAAIGIPAQSSFDLAEAARDRNFTPTTLDQTCVIVGQQRYQGSGDNCFDLYRTSAQLQGGKPSPYPPAPTPTPTPAPTPYHLPTLPKPAATPTPSETPKPSPYLIPTQPKPAAGSKPAS